MVSMRLSTLRRAGYGVLVLVAAWFTGACERQSAPSGPGAGQPTSAPAFTPPQADLSDWPAGLRERALTLREVIRKSPGNPEAIGALGCLHFVRGPLEAAAACFEEARRLAPSAMPWAYYAALTYELSGRRDQAISAYERAIELDASYGPLYSRLARLLVDTDVARAASLCQRALELSPRDPTALCVLGLCREAQGDAAAAQERFEAALKIAPDYKEAHAALARLLRAAGRDEEAARHQQLAEQGKTPVINDHLFESLLRNGFHIELLVRDAIVLAQQGDFERADQVLAMVREADDRGIATHKLAGMVRAIEGRLAEAAAEFQQVLQARPDALDVRARLADVLARMEKYDQAEANFRAVLARNPDEPFALEHYSRLLLVLGRSGEAEALWRGALERQPNEPWVRLQFGGLLMHLDRDEEAREQFAAALELAPDDPTALYSLGVLARRAGDSAQARQHWERIVAATPQYVDAYAGLAQLALEQGDRAAAERYLREGLKQVPDAPGLANTLAWILATSPDDTQRNGAEAVQLAERACDLTQHRQHEYLDTLAAAYAEAGRFDEAVRTAEQAVRLAEEAGDTEAAAGHRARLALYQQGQPYRDTGARRTP